MTQYRDVPLGEWLDKVGFHPADTELKQLGFGVTRQLIANTGAFLHAIIPPSDDKSTAFRLLGDVLMYANRALAVRGGPEIADGRTAGEAVAQLRRSLALLEEEAEALGASLQRDARYEAQQLADPAPLPGREGTLVPTKRGPQVTPAAEEGVLPDRATDGRDHRIEIPCDERESVGVAVRGAAVVVDLSADPGPYGASVAMSDPNAVSMLLEALSAAGNIAFRG